MQKQRIRTMKKQQRQHDKRQLDMWPKHIHMPTANYKKLETESAPTYTISTNRNKQQTKHSYEATQKQWPIMQQHQNTTTKTERNSRNRKQVQPPATSTRRKENKKHKKEEYNSNSDRDKLQSEDSY